MQQLDKEQLRSALSDRMESLHAALKQSQWTTQQGATHEEARPEHAKDTRATEASYLARGLARRVAELHEGAAAVARLELRDFETDDPAGLSALVALQDEAGSTRLIFLAPAGGGELLIVDGFEVQVLTPGSPLGRALIGRSVGDEVIALLPGGRQILEMVGLK